MCARAHRYNTTYIVLESYGSRKLIIKNGEAWLSYDGDAGLQDAEETEDDEEEAEEADGFNYTSFEELESGSFNYTDADVTDANVTEDEESYTVDDDDDTITLSSRAVCAGDATCSSFTLDADTGAALLARADSELTLAGFNVSMLGSNETAGREIAGRVLAKSLVRARQEKPICGQSGERSYGIICKAHGERLR